MPAGGPRMQNFQGVPGGMGGLGGGPAGQALSLARRIGTQPIGADPRPGTAGMGVQQGMQAGGHPDVHMAYNDQVVRKLPLADQQARGKQTSKAESAADNSKALKEISRLMGPNLPDPFAELQGQGIPLEHGFNPYFPGQTRVRSRPESQVPPSGEAQATIRQEPAVDMTRDLEQIAPIIYRALAVAASRNSPPVMGAAGLRGQMGQDMHTASQGSLVPPEVQHFGGLPIIPEKPVKTPPTSRSAARRIMAGQKRGGVAKKALALAKRRKRSSRKRK